MDLALVLQHRGLCPVGYTYFFYIYFFESICLKIKIKDIFLKRLFKQKNYFLNIFLNFVKNL